MCGLRAEIANEDHRRRESRRKSEESRSRVTYDDARTTVEALTKATASAGFPSTIKR